VAGLQQFDKSLFDLQQQLKDFKAAQETTLDPAQFVQYGQKINSLTKQIKDRFQLIAQANKDAATASEEQAATVVSSTKKIVTAVTEQANVTKQLTKTNSSATNSLFALSGIVQDAPFGFRAIANNITFFAQEMAYTTKTAGGFKAALTGMLGALTGPAGIIFGISAITSLLTVFFSGTGKAKDGTDELTISVHNLSEALAEGDKNAQKDITHLQLLYSAATNVNKPMAERLAAVKALQKEYPKYLGNISQEAILAGNAAGAYSELKDQIIASARARAAQDKIVDNQKQLLDVEAKLQTLAAHRNKLDAEIAEETKRAQAASASATNQMNSEALIVGVLAKRRTDVNNAIRETVTRYNQLTAANIKLSQSINTKDLIANPGGAVSKTPAAKPEKGDIRQAAFNVNNALQGARDAYRSFTQAASANIGDQVAAQFQKVGDAVKTVEPLLTDAQVKFQQFQTRLKEGMQQAAADIRQSAIDAIAGVTEGFATGGFKGAASALLSTLGDIAIQLGKIAIGVGIGIQGIQLALETLNPFAAIAAGVALVALGAIAKASASSLKLASGGVAYGPTSALIGEYPGAKSNPEVVAPLSKLKDLLGNATGNAPSVPSQIVLRANGSDLVAVLDLNNRKQSRRG
jgi:hypothetical protein